MIKKFLFIFASTLLYLNFLHPADNQTILLEYPTEQEIKTELSKAPKFGDKDFIFKKEIEIIKKFLDDKRYHNPIKNYPTIKTVLKEIKPHDFINYIFELDAHIEKIEPVYIEPVYIEEKKTIQNNKNKDEDCKAIKQPSNDINNSKKEFIQLINLLQDYSTHAKNLTLLLENNRDQIKNQLNAEIEKYELALTSASTLNKTLDKKSKEYQEQLLNYQKNLSYVKSLTKDDNTLKTLEELKKEENNLDFNKMINLTEVLYLLSMNEEDVSDNKTLYRKLALKFHPDKNTTSDKEGDIKSIVSEALFKDITPLLKDNSINNGLDKFQTQIQNIIIPEPSFIKQTITDIATLITGATAQQIGYETLTRMMPNRIQEARLYQQSIGTLFGTSLILQKKMMDLHTKQ